MQLPNAYIASAVRVAVGKAHKGALRNARPEALGAHVVQAAVGRVKGLDPEQIDDCLIGCAFPEGPQGMNLGRIVAQKAALPDTVPGATVNRFCSSGLQTIVMASQSVAAGHARVVVAGGVESMSRVPMSGFFFQPDPATVSDNPDVYVSMGITAENVAAKYGISREDQDAFALRSHQRALDAIEAGRFEAEIAPFEMTDVVYRDGETHAHTFTHAVDEGPRADTSLEALGKLRPAFRAGGSVTAGNSSQMNDGAAATVVADEHALSELGIDPMGRVVGFALAGVPAELMGIGPIGAIQKVLKQTGLSVGDIDLVELNEAFAAQALAVVREVGLDDDKVNVNGGAIALGHPLGCTGAKLTTTLLHEMERRGSRYGLVSMCVGGGMGAAAVIENLRR
jgi:acetyl-CoA acyltransferase